MSNVIQFQKPGNPGQSYAEATPSGINFVRLNDEGVPQQTHLVDYPSVVRQLDEGHFDALLFEGLGVVAELSLAGEKKYFTPTIDERLIVWRWMVTAVFIVEQMKNNGLVDVDQADGSTIKAAMYVGDHGGIVVYPATERLALANNIESLGYERYPAEQAPEMSLMIYQSMVEDDENNGFVLSKWGREAFVTLHDGFIQQLSTEGLPPKPTKH